MNLRQHEEEELEKDYNLLKELEEELRNEGDIREQRKLEKKIEGLKQRIQDRQRKIAEEKDKAKILDSINTIPNFIGNGIDDDFSDDLKTDRGVDYRRLQSLLKNGAWEQADDETVVVMLKAANREKQEGLDPKSINNFPRTDLHTIDQLWVRYSKGRFGFSVQKGIWEGMGGNPDADYRTWLQFADCVKWRVREEWINLDVSDNPSSFDGHFPDGHFPIMRRLIGGWGWKCIFVRVLFSRPNI